MRVAMAVVVGAACALTSGGRELPPAPPPRAKPTAEDWLPKLSSDPNVKWFDNLPSDPPSVFPDLVPPPLVARDEFKDGVFLSAVVKNRDALAKVCPRLHGTVALTIEPTDDPPRKLLKARLHQGVLEIQQHHALNAAGVSSSTQAQSYRTCLQDIQSAAVELWAEQPKELSVWLEELVVVTKLQERYTRTRIKIGTAPPAELNAVSRIRLKAEAELWKAKNAK